MYGNSVRIAKAWLPAWFTPFTFSPLYALFLIRPRALLSLLHFVRRTNDWCYAEHRTIRPVKRRWIPISLFYWRSFAKGVHHGNPLIKTKKTWRLFHFKVYVQGMIKNFTAQNTYFQQIDIKSQSDDNLILLKVFGRENRISKLLITVKNRCKEEKGVSNWQNGESWG